jgi:hypothetical protein
MIEWHQCYKTETGDIVCSPTATKTATSIPVCKYLPAALKNIILKHKYLSGDDVAIVIPPE